MLKEYQIINTLLQIPRMKKISLQLRILENLTVLICEQWKLQNNFQDLQVRKNIFTVLGSVWCFIFKEQQLVLDLSIRQYLVHLEFFYKQYELLPNLQHIKYFRKAYKLAKILFSDCCIVNNI